MQRGPMNRDREVKSKRLVFGTTPFKKTNGQWFDQEGAPTVRMTFLELFPEFKEKPKE